MLRARGRTTPSLGLLYVVLHFHSSFHPESGWCMDMKSMKTPIAGCWHLVAHIAQLPPRALASTTPARGGAARLRRRVGVVATRVTQRHDARERAAQSPWSRAREEAAYRRGVEEDVLPSRLERLADRHPAAAITRRACAPRAAGCRRRRSLHRRPTSTSAASGGRGSAPRRAAPPPPPAARPPRATKRRTAARRLVVRLPSSGATHSPRASPTLICRSPRSSRSAISQAPRRPGSSQPPRRAANYPASTRPWASASTGSRAAS